MERAVERLYRTFASHTLRKHVEGCPCCVSMPEKRALESTPLRELSAEALDRYAFKAMTTWGDSADFKYFFPRIFEIAIGGYSVGLQIEVVLGKLALAEWITWKQDEKDAVREFLRAGWNHLLAGKQHRPDVDHWLCGIALTGEDLDLYLGDWVNARSANAYQHLVEFVENNEPFCIKRYSLTNPFFHTCPKAAKQICDWAASEETRKELEKIYFENDSADFAPVISMAIQRLEWVAIA